MIRVAVAGATGYTGAELIRSLLLHPEVEVVRVTSGQSAGRPLAELHPFLRGFTDLVLEPLDPESVGKGVDWVFAALPHGTAAEVVAGVVRSSSARVVDLSADFRISDPEVFEEWYVKHPAPELLSEAVYAIPEFRRDDIRGARILSCPGCYPTGALFALIPLARAGIVGSGPLVFDSKSGVSGAGKSPRPDLLFGEVAENVRAYGVGSHRHTPEITQAVREAGLDNPVVFTPHLLPIRRGILTTAYVPLASEDAPLSDVYEEALGGEAFVRLLGEGASPEVRNVRGTNLIDMGWTVIPGSGTAIVLTAIDNLGRGASAQALQAFNIAAGLPEATGIHAIAAVP